MPKHLINKSNLLYGLIFVLLFLIYLFFLPGRGHGGDLHHWYLWTEYILHNGLANIYDFGTVYETIYPCNYPPVILYFFKIYSTFVPDGDFILREIKYFKVLPLIFDFISAAGIFFLIKYKPSNRILPAALLLSPAFVYNSYLWGQMDSIFTAFVAFSLIFALRKNWFLSIVLFIIALNTKMQALTFLPVFLLSILPLLDHRKKWMLALLTALAVQVLILLPFLISGTIDSWYQVMTSLVDQYTNVSLNAFNIWHLLLFENAALYTKDFEEFWFGMTYKNWGFLFFFTFSFFALFPLFLKSIHAVLKKITPETNFNQLVLLSAFLCALGFFFFNTQMHERYSHPAMLLAFLYGILSRNYWLYGITSLAYFLNLERTLRFFEISYGTFIFSKPFIASLFLLAILIGIWQLYKKHPIREDWKNMWQLLFHRNIQ